MSDLRRVGLHNQKREPLLAIFRLNINAAAELNAVARPAAAGVTALPAGAYVADLPARVLVTGVKTIVHTAGTGQLTVKVGATPIATNVAMAAGTKTVSTPVFFPTGGPVTLTPGAAAPAGAALDIEVVVEYIELDTLSGEYVG